MSNKVTRAFGLLLVLCGLACAAPVVRAETVIWVDRNDDLSTGAGLTLRKAIEEANRAPSGDLVRIRFKAESAYSSYVFTLGSPLPALVHRNVILDGRFDDGNDRRACIRIPDGALSNGQAILPVLSGGNVLQNLIIGGGRGTAILFSGSAATLNRVYRCALGFDPQDEGTPYDGMRLYYGIVLKDGAHDNVVGGPTADDLVLGNRITNCSKAGIYILGETTSQNAVQGNEIGSFTESSLYGNRVGVHIQDGPRNVVGGDDVSKGNAISLNQFNGILLEGPNATQNYFGRNSMWDNGLLGIDISRSHVGDGPNRAFIPELRQGPNNWITAPIIDSYYCVTTIDPQNPFYFYISGRAVPNSKIEIYEADLHMSGFGEGKTFLAEAVVGAEGTFFTGFYSMPGRYVTLLGNYLGSSSEFSQTLQLVQSSPTIPVRMIQSWQPFFLVPKGFTRQCGFTLSTPVTLGNSQMVNLTFLDPSIADAPSAVPVLAGRNFGTFGITGLDGGWTELIMRQPLTEGGTFCGVTVLCDDAETVNLDAGAFDQVRSLNGRIFYRFFRFTANAGDVISALAEPNGASPIDPVVVIFGGHTQNLAFNNDFSGDLDSFAQATIPEDGTYFVGVGDLYRYQGEVMSFRVRISKNLNELDMNTSFTSQQAFSTDAAPGRLALGDLNNDGYDDAVVALPGPKKLQVCLKDPRPDARFRSPVYIGLAFTPGAVNIADLDGNGWKDIVVSGLGSGGVTVLYNNGQFAGSGPLKEGSLAAMKRSFVPAAGGDIGANLDANADGFPDYALIDSGTGQLQVFLNDTHGNLLAGQSFLAGLKPLSIAISDLDLDGKTDLAIADNTSNAINLFGGQGDGTFLGRGSLGGFAAPVDVKSTDLDNDGIPDLAAVSETTGGLRTFRGTGSFNYQAYQDLASGTQPNSLAISDINGDGVEDAAVSCSVSNDIYIYQGGSLGLLIPIARLTQSGEIVQLYWYSFGIAGSYIGVAPDEQFVQVLQGTYSMLDFPFAESGSLVRSAFAFANPSDTDALVYFSIYNPDGTLVSDAQVQNPVAMTIQAHRQASFFTDELFGAGVSFYKPSMRAYSLNPAVQGFSLLVGNTGNLRMDGTTAMAGVSAHQVLPSPSNVPGSLDAGYSVENPGSATATVTVTCRNAAGQTQGTPRTFDIAPDGRATFSFSQYFAGSTEPCYLDFSSDRIFECFQYADSPEFVSAGNGLPVPDPATDALVKYVPHFAEGRLYRSTLDLVNTGPAAVQVTLRALNDDGAQIAQSLVLNIPAYGALRGDLDDLLGLDSESADVISGFLRIESSLGGVTGVLTFSDRVGGRFASTLPIQAAGGARWVFSHVAVGSIGGINYFTGITVLNAGTADAPVHFSVYDQLGALKGEGDFTVPAGRKASRMLTDFVPGLQAQAGGYVTLTCSDPSANLFTYELFGNDGLAFLSAVPAQRLQ